jgi:hypothetical protein
MSEETVTFNLELNVETALSNARQLEFILYRTFGLLNRLGLPSEINQAIIQIQRLIMMIRLLHTTMIMLELATGPIGWAKAILSAGALTISTGQILGDYAQELQGH